MKAKVLLTSCLFFFCVIFLSSCDYFGTINQAVGGGGLSAAVRVNNGAAGRSVIGAGDRVELYITWLGYVGSPFYDSGNQLWENINIVMFNGMYWVPGHTEQVYQRHNEDWYTPDSPFFKVTNNPADGVYNLAKLRITAMRIGDREYPFPNFNGEVSYGIDIHNHLALGGHHFPDAFRRPITFDNTVSSILTVLDVPPNILECWEDTGTPGISSTDDKPVTIHQLRPNANPYAYITVVGTTRTGFSQD